MPAMKVSALDLDLDLAVTILAIADLDHDLIVLEATRVQLEQLLRSRLLDGRAMADRSESLSTCLRLVVVYRERLDDTD